MSIRIRLDRVGPLATIQDRGREGMLAYGISASGPMDRAAFEDAARRAGSPDRAGIEFTTAGLDITVVSGDLAMAWAGGAFHVTRNDKVADWPGGVAMGAGDRLSIRPGPAGNYGYLLFGAAMDLPSVLGSRSTSTRVGLGGLEGRALRAGDVLDFSGTGGGLDGATQAHRAPGEGPLRFIWGLHAALFSPKVRERFLTASFRVTSAMDRMGVRLKDDDLVFGGEGNLSLVSAPIVAGDIQILGDGTPIVLMRDHQPTGGYPRIGTVIGSDLDRFAQMRPGTRVTFSPITVQHAHDLMRMQPR